MELMNPRMTVQNAVGPHWLVSFEHDFGGGEMVMLTVRVSKTNHSVGQVEREAWERLQELIQVLTKRMQRSPFEPQDPEAG